MDSSNGYWRTWFSGRGGQCPRKLVGTGDHCTVHAKREAFLQGLAHGRVTGPTPRGKMARLLREACFVDGPVLRKNVSSLVDLAVEGLHNCVDLVFEHVRSHFQFQPRPGAKTVDFGKPS